MLSYFIETPKGANMLDAFPGLQQWKRLLRLRQSARATPFHKKADDETEYH
jgi:hypothetical protein